MLCEDPEGWVGRVWGSGGQGCEDVCMRVADSLCCAVETDAVLWSIYTPIEMWKKKEKIKV